MQTLVVCLLILSLSVALVLYSAITKLGRSRGERKMHLFGLHDQGGEHLFREANVQGWTVYAEAIGDDPNDHGGKEFSTESTAICRLAYGWYGTGNIPDQTRYDRYAQRCANFVAASKNCKRWIIGNEPNLTAERPPLPDGSSEVITPERFAECFKKARSAIKAVQPDAIVILGAVAPWNNQTQYAGNEAGDWVHYYVDTLELLGTDGLDGIALHTYSHGNTPDHIYSDAKMGAPFDNRNYNFKSFQDFLNETPTAFKHLPVFITEFDGDEHLWGENNGFIQAAYGEVNWWNQQPNTQKVQCLALYRWGAFDKWQLSDKDGSIQDFKNAMLQFTPSPEPLVKQALGAGISVVVGSAVQQASKIKAGDIVNVNVDARMRSAPSAAGSIVTNLSAGVHLRVTGESQQGNGITWWPVEGANMTGFVAEIAPDSTRILEAIKAGISLVRPCDGPETQQFGERPEYYSQIKGYAAPLKGHNGLDYGLTVGSEVKAADEGYIYDIRNEDGGFGLHVLIQHEWGATLYAHLSEVIASKNQPVGRGQVFARSGASGAGSGPHLHFGVKVYPNDKADGWGGYTNPKHYLED